MKASLLNVKFFALVFLLALWGCSSENVSPGNAEESNSNTPTLAGDGSAHPTVEPECSPRVTYALMDESGGTDVNYFGPFGIPSGTPTPWGSITMVNSDAELVVEIDMAFGWYVDLTESYLGPETGIAMVNGIPNKESNWLQINVNPVVNTTELIIPLSTINDPCFSFAINLSVVKLDFFQGIDESSRTSLWVRNDAWNDPTQPENNTSSVAVNNWCIASCGPVVTTETAGNCQGCQSENTVEMLDCDTANVSSCKDLSNVVLLFTDNSYQKFDGLSAKTGTFYGTGANDGKEIARVYVKSGCYQSGDGPGWGLRFDTPCNDDNLISVPGTGGGGNGNGNGGNGNGGNGNGGGGNGNGNGKNK